MLAVLAAVLLFACAGVSPIPTPTPSPPPPTVTASATPSPAPSLTPPPPLTPTASPTPGPVCTIAWIWREQGLVITAVDPTRADGLYPGDLVLDIDGRSAEELILEIETGLGGIGDPELRRQTAVDSLLFTHPVLILRVRHGQQPPYYYNLHPDCH